MLRSQRLQVVLKLEEQKEHKALEKMAVAQQAHEAQHQQIDKLQRYQREYRDQIRANQHGVVPVSRLQAWQAFIAQLDQVIVQQQTVLNQARAKLDARREEWQKTWERRRGMEKYIETCRRQERQELDTQEQKLADEAASRVFQRRR
jgi:flagellar FliJ protein